MYKSIDLEARRAEFAARMKQAIDEFRTESMDTHKQWIDDLFSGRERISETEKNDLLARIDEARNAFLSKLWAKEMERLRREAERNAERHMAEWLAGQDTE